MRNSDYYYNKMTRKRFISGPAFLAGMVLALGMFMFTSCSSDDDDNDNGSNLPAAKGWSGNENNGESFFRPEFASDDESVGEFYCAFSATAGMCTKAEARLQCESNDMADALYEYLINGGFDDEDDYDEAKGHAGIQMFKAAMRTTRAVSTDDAINELKGLISKSGRTIIGRMSISGVKMSDVRKAFNYYWLNETGQISTGFTYGYEEEGYFNLKNMPEQPLFGMIGDITLNYTSTPKAGTMANIAGITNIDINVNRSNNLITGITQKLTFKSEQAANEFNSNNGDSSNGFTRNGNILSMTVRLDGIYNEVSYDEAEDYVKRLVIMMDITYHEPIAWMMLSEF